MSIQLQAEPRSGRSQTASTEQNKERDDEFTEQDKLVTVNVITANLAIGHNAVE